MTVYGGYTEPFFVNLRIFSNLYVGSLGTTVERVPFAYVSTLNATAILVTTLVTTGSLVAGGAAPITINGATATISTSAAELTIDDHLSLNDHELRDVTALGEVAKAIANAYITALTVGTVAMSGDLDMNSNDINEIGELKFNAASTTTVKATNSTPADTPATGSLHINTSPQHNSQVLYVRIGANWVRVRNADDYAYLTLTTVPVSLAVSAAAAVITGALAWSAYSVSNGIFVADNAAGTITNALAGVTVRAKIRFVLNFEYDSGAVPNYINFSLFKNGVQIPGNALWYFDAAGSVVTGTVVLEAETSMAYTDYIDVRANRSGAAINLLLHSGFFEVKEII